MSKLSVITLLESVLGKGRQTTSDNIAFNCPFCNHHKPKLEINLLTQYWHCWVCNVAGRKVPILFRKLNAGRDKISQAVKEFDEIEYKPTKTTTDTPVIELPKEYKPLWKLDKTNPEFRNALRYLFNRGLTLHDVLKYRIGYCENGLYSGKIIIPSYDANGSLNYFVGRAYYSSDNIKHKNPKISKDIIGFELHINWSLPIVLVEGAFDAIAIRRNAIPLFGKTISNTLKKRIVEQKVKTIYICLDLDARKQALETAEYFINNGIDVYFVELTGKDPSDMGYTETKYILDTTIRLTEQQLMHEKILCAL
jgi:DNA primase